MIETFYSPLTPAHGLADLGIGELLHELKDEQVLSLRRQETDDLQDGILVLALHESHLGRLALVVEGGGVIQGDLLVAAAVPVPVGDKVMRNPIEPGRKRYSPIRVMLDVVEGAVEDAGGQILRVVDVAGAVIDVVENTVDVAG